MEVRPRSARVFDNQAMSIRQLIFVSGWLLALQVQAQEPSPAPPAQAGHDAVSLNQALQAARDNLDVALARHSLAAAKADELSANRSPFVALSASVGGIDLQNGNGSGNPLTEQRYDKSIGLDWTWERGNKRELRTQAARKAIDAAQADLDEIRIQQLLAAHAGFFDLLANQERLTQVTLIEQSTAQLASSAHKRLQAGDLSAQDAARTDIEAQRATSDTQLAELDRQRAALVLWQLTGLQTRPETLQAEPDWPALDSPLPTVTDIDTVVEARSDVRAAKARAEAAQAALDASSAQRHADITWGASYDHYPGTSTALVQLRMQMPLQWGYNYQGEIGRAAAQLSQAQDVLERTRRMARSELQRLWQTVTNAAVRARIYRDQILPRARKVSEAAELAYLKGALSLTDLLDARRTLRTSLIEDLNARTDYAKAHGAWRLRTQPETALSSN
jgi:cobalt-zinc-cadmium efflux system outer membrane protein